MKVITLFLALGFLAAGAAAQDCAFKTGNSAILVIPPTLEAPDLQEGDIIIARSEMLCAGEGTYEPGRALSITLWGDDNLTEAVDGIPPGTSVAYSIYRPSTGIRQDQVVVTYSGHDGRYAADNIMVMSALILDAPLSVELVQFAAYLDGATAVLGWETATETNNAGFDIELLGADSTFRSLTFVAGAGTTQTPHHYRYRVPELAPGMHRFRLKQRDHDGRFAYSETVEVVVPVPSSYYLTEAYPNPFNPEARLLMTLRSSELVEAGLYDLQGRLVRVLHRGEVPAGVPFPIEVVGGGLSSGVYLVRVQGASFVTTRTLTLLK